MANRQTAAQKMASALAFVGGTLAGTDQRLMDDSQGSDTSYYAKDNYQEKVRQGINLINREMIGTPQFMPVPQYQQQVPYQQPIPQYENQQYYQPIQNQSENDMPDIDKYLGKKKKKPVVQQSGNPVLNAITDSKAPILQKLEMLCAIMGEIYQVQTKTNALLSLICANANIAVDDELIDEEAEDEVAEEIAMQQEPMLSPEEEIARLDAMSREMQKIDEESASHVDEE